MNTIFENKDTIEILNTLSEGIIITDPNGNILYCNNAAAENFFITI